MMMVPMSFQQQEQDSKNGNKNYEESDGFNTAAKKMTVSNAVLEGVPTNVRVWAAKDVLLWLNDVFQDAEDLPE